MSTWLATIGAAIVVATASWWMWRRHPHGERRLEQRDPHRGDWPPDQMAR